MSTASRLSGGSRFQNTTQSALGHRPRRRSVRVPVSQVASGGLASTAIIDTVARVTSVEPPDDPGPGDGRETDPPPSDPPPSDRSGGGSAARALLRILGAIPGRRDDAVAIVNGLFGDTLDERRSDLATPMSIRVGDMPLPLDRAALAVALAESGAPASRRICVLVHGLMSTEAIWRFPDDPTSTYGALLADDRDLTVVSLRYNTGRRIASNGRDFALVLDQLVAAWPVRVREINLIGHSMGGLVVRSACHYGASPPPRRRWWPFRRRWWPFRRRWARKVRRVVLIGVPNTGAGLEALVSSLSGALAAFPIAVTRAVGRGLDRRSAGIKDLRLGTIIDDETNNAAPKLLPLRRASYLIVAGSVTTDPDHRIARLFGDTLVTSASATGRTDDIELFPGATVRTFPKVTHNALAHHPVVHRAIADWW